MTKRETLGGVGIALVLGFGLSACASPSDISDLRAQVDTVSTRVAKLERNGGGAASSGGSQLADMETRLDNQKLRIARLRDKVERINHRLDELMNRIETQNAQAASVAPSPAPAPVLAKPPAPATVTTPPAGSPALVPATPSGRRR